jgi:hypothetical protein
MQAERERRQSCFTQGKKKKNVIILDCNSNILFEVKHKRRKRMQSKEVEGGKGAADVRPDVTYDSGKCGWWTQ